MNVYDIKHKLAEGHYGSVVFLAENNGGKQSKLAIVKKFPSNDHQTDYIKDLRKMCDLDTIHVIKLYGMMVQSKALWVALEYCAGRSVRDLIAVFERPLKESHIRTILQHVLKGLVYLHHLSIIHRGIKCSNILVNSRGICKLSEFGTSGHGVDTVTMDSFVGNSFWLAPEVLQEVQYTVQADIWSIGITLIEMCEGNPPYHNIHPMRVILSIPNKAPPTFNNPDLWTKQLKMLLRCCLQKCPTERHSASQLLQHKIIKRADSKGVQGITQKAIKVLSRDHMTKDSDHMTISNDQSEISVTKQVTEEVSDDEDNWAQSGTLVWNPVKHPVVKHPVVEHPVMKPDNCTRPQGPTPYRASVSEVHDEEYEMDTVRPSDFIKAKEQQKNREQGGVTNHSAVYRSHDISQPITAHEVQGVVPKTTAKGKETGKFKNLKSENKSTAKNGGSASRSLEHPITSTVSTTSRSLQTPLPSTTSSLPKNSDNRSNTRLETRPELKQHSEKWEEGKHSEHYEESTLELFGASTKESPLELFGASTKESTLELFGAATNTQHSATNTQLTATKEKSPRFSEPSDTPLAGPGPSKCISEPPDSLIRRPSCSKSIDEIPYFMQYYDRKTPATLGEASHPTLYLSFFELQTKLDDLDYMRGEEMELIKNRYSSYWSAIMECIKLKEGALSTPPDQTHDHTPDQAPNIYKLLSKAELLIQLSMIQRRHRESTGVLVERFKLEKQFIRDTTKQYLATNQSKVEERRNSMKDSIERKEAEYQCCFNELKKGYRREYEYILKAIEFVDYTMVATT